MRTPDDRNLPPEEPPDGCISDIVGPVGWPAAFVVAAVVLLWFGSGWLDDRDDARLDQLRQTAIQSCADHTESTTSLTHCVTATLQATGQHT